MPTFGKYYHHWLEDYIKTTKRTTTYILYSGMWENHLKSLIGNLPLNEIKRGDVKKILMKIYRKGLSKSSVEKARNVMSGVFEYAIDEEVINFNPATGLMKKIGFDRRKDREPVQPMIPEEVTLFLENCFRYAHKWYPFFLCLFRSGMRLGEALALQWGDIDWNGRFIHVQRSFRQGRTTGTKTGRSRRVDMSNQLYDGLKGLYTQRRKEALKRGESEPVDIIFHTNGKATSQNTIRNIWKRILRKAGIRDMKLHVSRHTFSSLLLSNGQSPVYVKEQLGHSSIQMTVDIYGHLIPNSNRDAVNQLDSTAPIRNLSATPKSIKAVTP